MKRIQQLWSVPITAQQGWFAADAAGSKGMAAVVRQGLLLPGNWPHEGETVKGF